jgi:hypothetical protein
VGTLAGGSIERGDPADEVAAGGEDEGSERMIRNTFRGVLGLVLAAGAAWLADYITRQVFGPEEEDRRRA